MLKRKSFCVVIIILSFIITSLVVQDTNAAISADPKLEIPKDILSVKIGAVEYLNAHAFDSKGNGETFTFSKTGSASTVVLENTSYFSITGVSSGIDYLNVTSGSGVSKTIQIKVYDPMILDDGNGLLIAFVDQFDWKWHDEGTGADMYGKFSHPIVPSDTKYQGFHALGSLAQGTWTNPNGIEYSVIVKDKNNASLLAPPVDYEWIWSDWGSGGDYDGSFWRPIAPAGYACLGTVAQSGYNKPSTDVIRYVKEELTVKAKTGSLIYNDAGSGADYDFGSWRITEPDNIASEDGKAFLSINTFVSATSHNVNAVNMSNARMLYISLPIMDSYDDAESEPYLTGYHSFDNFKPRFSRYIYVPFTLMKDNVPDHNLHWKVVNSPFYFLARVEEYTSVDFFDNRQGSKDVTKTLTIETGYSTTETSLFSTELGIEVSAGGEVGLFGTGGSWSVSVQTTLKWESSTANTYSVTTTKSTEYTVPAGKFGELLQVTGKFLLISGNDFTIGTLPMKSSGLKILEYPLSENNSQEIPGFATTVIGFSLVFLAMAIGKKRRPF